MREFDARIVILDRRVVGSGLAVFLWITLKWTQVSIKRRFQSLWLKVK